MRCSAFTMMRRMVVESSTTRNFIGRSWESIKSSGGCESEIAGVEQLAGERVDQFERVVRSRHDAFTDLRAAFGIELRARRVVGRAGLIARAASGICRRRIVDDCHSTRTWMFAMGVHSKP